MPYRVEAGEKVMLVDREFACKEVTFKRPVDFMVSELIASPLEEHNDEGINTSRYDTYPWGFSVVGKWDAGTMAEEVSELYATEVFQIRTVGEEAKMVNVQGSGKNIYTMKILNDRAVHCSCRGFRFAKGGKGCKHTRNWIPED